MKFVALHLLVLLLSLALTVQGAANDVFIKPCTDAGGSCVAENSCSGTDQVNGTTCPTGEVCCKLNAMITLGHIPKEIEPHPTFKKSPRQQRGSTMCSGTEKQNCKKNKGTCASITTCPQGYIEIMNGCKSSYCKCCAMVCKKTTCSGGKGTCVSKKSDCYGIITGTQQCSIPGIPKKCYCCIPGTTTKAPTTIPPVS